MTAVDAHAVAAWRYPGEYSFYDADADPDDLAELLDPAEWGQRYFASDEKAHHELAGFLVVKLTGREAGIGLGLRPDLTGHGRVSRSSAPACNSPQRRLGRRAIPSPWLRSTAGRSPCTSRPVSGRLSASSTSPTAGFMPLSAWPGPRSRARHDAAGPPPHRPAALLPHTIRGQMSMPTRGQISMMTAAGFERDRR